MDPIMPVMLGLGILAVENMNLFYRMLIFIGFGVLVSVVVSIAIRKIRRRGIE